METLRSECLESHCWAYTTLHMFMAMSLSGQRCSLDWRAYLWWLGTSSCGLLQWLFCSWGQNIRVLDCILSNQSINIKDGKDDILEHWHVTHIQLLESSKDLPVSCGLGQFVLRLPVVGVQAEHKASSTQLSLGLLQLLRQIEHLPRRVVCILNTSHHSVSRLQHRTQFPPHCWHFDNTPLRNVQICYKTCPYPYCLPHYGEVCRV